MCSLYVAGELLTCFRMRSNMRMKQPRFMSSSSQSRSRAQWPMAWPRFLKGLQRRGLRNGLLKGLGKGLRVLCCPRRPGSDTTLTYRSKDFQPQVKAVGLYTVKMDFFGIINISFPENAFSTAQPEISVMAPHHSQVQLSLLRELYLGSCSYYGNIQYMPVNGGGKGKETCTSSAEILLHYTAENIMR